MRLNAKILVVEDNPGTRELMASLLTRMGCDVATAGSVEEASVYLQSKAPCDLVLADIVLPGASGLELGAKGQALRPGLPIIYLSGYPEAVADAIEAGNAPIQKPVAWTRLRRAIEAALERSPRN